VNGELFNVDARGKLVPRRRSCEAVVVDNPSNQESMCVRMPIELVGAMLRFLPSDRPYLNSIKLSFSIYSAKLNTSDSFSIQKA
jgi:hypothetical protein